MGCFAVLLVANYGTLFAESLYFLIMSLRVKYKILSNLFRDVFWETVVDTPKLNHFSRQVVTAGSAVAACCCLAGLMLSLPNRSVKKDTIIHYDVETKQNTSIVFQKHSSISSQSESEIPSYINKRIKQRWEAVAALERERLIKAQEKNARELLGLNEDYDEEEMNSEEQEDHGQDTRFEGDSKQTTDRLLFSSFDETFETDSISVDLGIDAEAKDLPENIFLATCRRFPHLGAKPLPGVPKMRNSLLSGTGGRPLFLDENYVPVIWELDRRPRIIVVKLARTNHLGDSRARRTMDIYLMTAIVLCISIAMMQILLAFELFEMRLTIYYKYGPDIFNTSPRDLEKMSAFRIMWGCEFYNTTAYPRMLGPNRSDCAKIYREMVAEMKIFAAIGAVIPIGCFLLVVIMSMSSYTKAHQDKSVQTQPEDNWVHGCGGTRGELRDVGVDCTRDVYDSANKKEEVPKGESISDAIRRASQLQRLSTKFRYSMR